jgi:hypothetical protein
MTDAQQTNQWPHITDLLDQEGGHISIGRMPPIESAAIAVNDQTLIASLASAGGLGARKCLGAGRLAGEPAGEFERVGRRCATTGIGQFNLK